MSMRGLTQFIGDIRNCQNKEEERKRVDKEMANIRKNFKNVTGLTNYQKKKYVWKMLYIYVLGYEVDFGHMEALNLITAPGYAEKTVGYLACVLLLSETNEFLRLIINSTKNDLASQNQEIQALALACIANVGGREFAETLAGDVQKILLSQNSHATLKKKAALCMLRLLRKYPEAFGEDGISNVPGHRDKLIDLLDDSSLGVVSAVMSLILGLAANWRQYWGSVVNRCCKLLCNLNNNTKDYAQEYVYYKTINPWLQIKILRLLQYYPAPEKKEVYDRMCEVLAKILKDTVIQKNVNINNAAHSVLFEVVNYVIHIETNKELIGAAVSMLGQRLTAANQPNYRYLALELMQRMCHIPEASRQFRQHQKIVSKALNDGDVSLRRRALDVLYSMCDCQNSAKIVDELLTYLEGSDYAIREELVLRVAILSERFSPNLRWYVDTILKLLALAGNYVSDQVWMRVVQMVTNHEDLQVYAAETCFKALSSEPVHESMVKCGGYIIGEFGHTVSGRPEFSGEKQYELLRDKFVTGVDQVVTRQILITAFVKLMSTHAHLKGTIGSFLSGLMSTMEPELQQRALEYVALAQPGREGLLETALEAMPDFPERENILLKQMSEREGRGAGGTAREGEEHSRVDAEHGGGTSEDTQQQQQPADLLDLGSGGGGEVAQSSNMGATTTAAAANDLDDLLGGLSVSGSAATSSSVPHGGAASNVGQLNSAAPSMLDDLLGGGGAVAPSPAASVPAGLGGGGGGGDLLGMGMGGGGVSATMPMAMWGGGASTMAHLLGGGELGGTVGGKSPEEMRKVWDHGLVIGDHGTMYEDQGLLIEAQMMFQGNMSKIKIRYLNKGGGGIEGLRAFIEPVPYLMVQDSGVPSSLPPQGGHFQMIQLKVVDMFRVPPTIKIGFSIGGHPSAIQAPLPVTILKFLTPVECTKEQYFAVWGKMTGQPNEVTQVVRSQRALSVSELGECVKGMRYSLLSGIDPKPDNLCGAGKLNIGIGDIFTVLRIETKGNAYSVTVKASHPSLAAAALQAVTDYVALH